MVLASAVDAATLESVAAAWLLREHAPELRVRVVNVVDLMALLVPRLHPHGMDDAAFEGLVTRQAPVVFAFHGHQRAVHELVHARASVERFHVRGFNEEGITTTPFDMVVKNGMSRHRLCLDAVKYAPRLGGLTQALTHHCTAMLARHEAYIREHLEDVPEVRDWTWSAP